MAVRRYRVLDASGRTEEILEVEHLATRTGMRLPELALTIESLLATLSQDNHGLALQIAALPETMRGFGHIKEKNVKTAKEREASLLQAYRQPVVRATAAE